jgi:hypothetical protein
MKIIKSPNKRKTRASALDNIVPRLEQVINNIRQQHQLRAIYFIPDWYLNLSIPPQDLATLRDAIDLIKDLTDYKEKN